MWETAIKATITTGSNLIASGWQCRCEGHPERMRGERGTLPFVSNKDVADACDNGGQMEPPSTAPSTLRYCWTIYCGMERPADRYHPLSCDSKLLGRSLASIALQYTECPLTLVLWPNPVPSASQPYQPTVPRIAPCLPCPSPNSLN